MQLEYFTKKQLIQMIEEQKNTMYSERKTWNRYIKKLEFENFELKKELKELKK